MGAGVGVADAAAAGAAAAAAAARVAAAPPPRRAEGRAWAGVEVVVIECALNYNPKLLLIPYPKLTVSAGIALPPPLHRAFFRAFSPSTSQAVAGPLQVTLPCTRSERNSDTCEETFCTSPRGSSDLET